MTDDLPTGNVKRLVREVHQRFRVEVKVVNGYRFTKLTSKKGRGTPP